MNYADSCNPYTQTFLIKSISIILHIQVITNLYMVSGQLVDQKLLSYFTSKFISNERKNFFFFCDVLFFHWIKFCALIVVSMTVLQNVP